MRVLLTSLLTLLVFSGCFGPEPKSKFDKPDWVLHPEPGVMAMAYMHASGSVAKQKEVAMQRAREELARQMGIDISLVETKRETYNNGRSTLQTTSGGESVVKNKTVIAHEKAYWIDPMSGNMYVWVVAD